MELIKVCVFVMGVLFCMVDGENCVRKENLCDAVPPAMQDRVSCVVFTGNRMLLSCAGREEEKVVFFFSSVKYWLVYSSG
jgi:hypothetical protein